MISFPKFENLKDIIFYYLKIKNDYSEYRDYANGNKGIHYPTQEFPAQIFFTCKTGSIIFL